ncbi:MAG: hypothetical protein R3D58_11285 [Saprospiraceae bacterium]
MNTHPSDKLIQDYLRGRMPAAERDQFEQQLESDPELAEEVALQRAELAAAERLIESETRAWMREWQQPAQPAFRAARFWWLAAVAAGAVLLIAAIYVFRQPGTTTPKDQAEQVAPPANNPIATETLPAPVPAPQPAPAQKPVATNPAAPNYLAEARLHFQEPVLSDVRRTNTDSVVSLIRQAQAAYAAADYRRTLDLLAQTDSTRLQSATFLEAHALFHLDRFAEAEARFESLIAQNSRQFRYPAEWGLLICRLANFPKREQVFQQQLDALLDNPQHPYFEQAKNLESALKK